MKLLALDTSTHACTVGAMAGTQTAIRHEERPREHTRILVPMIRETLAEVGLDAGDLEAVVLGNGPGSFIGMRIAASVAQGLAWGNGIGVVPVSSLAAVAAAAGGSGDVVAVAQDAHMNEVYLGLYRIDDGGTPAELASERLQPLAAIAELAGHSAVIAAGAGWQRYPALFDANRGHFAAEPAVLYPHARELLTLGARALAAADAIDPAELEPAYLRAKVAATP